jgi:hypothetical protein
MVAVGIDTVDSGGAAGPAGGVYRVQLTAALQTGFQTGFLP